MARGASRLATTKPILPVQTCSHSDHTILVEYHGPVRRFVELKRHLEKGPSGKLHFAGLELALVKSL